MSELWYSLALTRVDVVCRLVLLRAPASKGHDRLA